MFHYIWGRFKSLSLEEEGWGLRKIEAKTPRRLTLFRKQCIVLDILMVTNQGVAVVAVAKASSKPILKVCRPKPSSS